MGPSCFLNRFSPLEGGGGLGVHGAWVILVTETGSSLFSECCLALKEPDHNFAKCRRLTATHQVSQQGGRGLVDDLCMAAVPKMELKVQATY